MNFKGAAQALVVMIGVPVSAGGAIWTLSIARFNTSIAVWVGMIAETASVTVVYLDIPAVYVVWRGHQLKRSSS